MHPARSVIAFTTLAGAGYGLLFLCGLLLAAGTLAVDSAVVATALGAGTVLVTAGLLASTLHLGHPERAWRALSQWRSSWLSREGVAALLTYLPIVLALAAVFAPSDSGLAGAAPYLGVLLAIGSAATVLCTAMIYASLRSIARWHHPLVLPVYLLFALLSGAAILWAIDAVAGSATRIFGIVIVAIAVIAWVVKWRYWRATDQKPIAGSIQSATGLAGKIRIFDPPHTEDNYLLTEMGFAVARRHAAKLRRLATLAGLALPLALVLPALWWPAALQWLAVPAAFAIMLGVVVERWLFFAEAQHSLMHYYGAPASNRNT